MGVGASGAPMRASQVLQTAILEPPYNRTLGRDIPSLRFEPFSAKAPETAYPPLHKDVCVGDADHIAPFGRFVVLDSVGAILGSLLSV